MASDLPTHPSPLLPLLCLWLYFFPNHCTIGTGFWLIFQHSKYKSYGLCKCWFWVGRGMLLGYFYGSLLSLLSNTCLDTAFSIKPSQPLYIKSQTPVPSPSPIILSSCHLCSMALSIWWTVNFLSCSFAFCLDTYPSPPCSSSGPGM